MLSEHLYTIAEKTNVLIVCEPLGNIDGYSHIVEGQKIIHLNESLSDPRRGIVLWKLMLILSKGEEGFVICSNDDLISDDAFVHYVFSVFSVLNEEIENFTEQIMNRVIKIGFTIQSDSSKLVS